MRDTRFSTPGLTATVFLRALEYYSGILILTTNRVGSFDEAVISRMAAIVHFKELDADQKQKIRVNCLNNLPHDRIKIDESAKALYTGMDNEAQNPHPWNGREIVAG
jgi:SpoVK/Ycf46/Vps4 family AAA+-type ATPase